jgi:hypothetical protein
MTTQTHYIDDARYHFEVRMIRDLLRRSNTTLDERRMAIASGLSLAGLDMGALVLTGGTIRPEHYGDLVDVLAELEPCAWTGELEANDVIIALGEFGNVWPENIRSIQQSAA